MVSGMEEDGSTGSGFDGYVDDQTEAKEIGAYVYAVFAKYNLNVIHSFNKLNASFSWSPLCDLNASYNDSAKVDSSIIPGSIDINKFYYSQDGTNLKAIMPGNSMSYK